MNTEERTNKYLKRLEEFQITGKKTNEYVDAFLDYEGMNAELQSLGYPDELDFPHTTAYVNALKPLNDDFIKVVIEWIPRLKYPYGVVQYLRESKSKYDGRVLIPIFNESDAQGKWFLCDAIAYNPPLYINEWYLDKQYGYSETGLLPLAVAKMFSRDEARNILKQGFDHHYRVSPEAFGKVGKLEDIPFLEEKLLANYDATHVKKDIEKAIKKIKKRVKLL